MKKCFLYVVILLTGHLNAQIDNNRDVIVSSIESRIKLPIILDVSIDVTNYGAKGDGIKDCKKAFPEFKVENVTLDHLTLASAKNGMTLTNTSNVTFNEVVIGEKQTVPSAAK